MIATKYIIVKLNKHTIENFNKVSNCFDNYKEALKLYNQLLKLYPNADIYLTKVIESKEG